MYNAVLRSFKALIILPKIVSERKGMVIFIFKGENPHLAQSVIPGHSKQLWQRRLVGQSDQHHKKVVHGQPLEEIVALHYHNSPELSIYLNKQVMQRSTPMEYVNSEIQVAVLLVICLL